MQKDKVNFKTMSKTQIQDTFAPDEELLEFANFFSKDYRTLCVGDYFSNEKKYHIRYVDEIKGETQVRVALSSGRIEFDRFKIISEDCNEDVIFFWIMWCVIQRKERDIMKSDLMTITYYLTTNRPLASVQQAFLNICITNQRFNLERIKKLFEAADFPPLYEVEEIKTLLWLDDKRDPFNELEQWLLYSPLKKPFKTVWIKSFNEFTKWINTKGLPDAICFDHDLGEDEAQEKVARGINKKKARAEKKLAKSGMDCAKWLVEYCLDNKCTLPLYNIQSSNPAGKENIDGLFRSFIKTMEGDNS